MTSGASVRMRVSRECVGPTLHALESLADVFLLRRDRSPSKRGVEIWHLRSDRFPPEWEGWWVNPTFTGTNDQPILADWKAQPE